MEKIYLSRFHTDLEDRQDQEARELRERVWHELMDYQQNSRRMPDLATQGLCTECGTEYWGTRCPYCQQYE